MNLIPITLLTKHAKISFLNQDPKRKYGLIQLASSASDVPFPLITHYGATKRYGEWIAHCINLRNLRKERTENIDTLIVKPGLVTTPMVKNCSTYNSCYPEETSRGSLCDLGVNQTNRTYGSMKHNFEKMITNTYFPEICFYAIRRHFGAMDIDLNEKMN